MLGENGQGAGAGHIARLVRAESPAAGVAADIDLAVSHMHGETVADYRQIFRAADTHGSHRRRQTVCLFAELADDAGNGAKPALQEAEKADRLLLSFRIIVIIIDAKYRVRLQRRVAAVGESNLRSAARGAHRVTGVQCRALDETPLLSGTVDTGYLTNAELDTPDISKGRWHCQDHYQTGKSHPANPGFRA